MGMPDSEMEEIHKIFFEESFEGLDVMESSLLLLGAQPDRETINTIFRAAHSIKGGAATFDFTELAHFTHGIETLLDQMRTGERTVTSEAVQLLLQSVDCLRGMVTAAQAGTAVDQVTVEALNADLARMLSSAQAAAPAMQASTASAPAPSASSLGALSPSASLSVSSAMSASPGTQAAAACWEIEFRPKPELLRTRNEPARLFAELARLGPLTVSADCSGVPSLATLDPEDCHLAWHIVLGADVERARLDEIFDWVSESATIDCRRIDPPGTIPEAQPPIAAPIATPIAAPAQPTEAHDLRLADASASGKGVDTGSIRVSTEKVDALVNLVGELVITQSILSRFSAGVEVDQVEALRDALAQLARNTRQLQESVMQVRMLPISFCFNRFGRLVHELSRRLGKQVELELSGEGTELDKTVLEKIGDPLVHLVRNALDHGLETPEARVAAGKPPTGVLELRAYHEGGNIIIEVRDDGAGLNRARILAKARERGLIAADAVLNDEQVHNLIFAPGFSTAQQVSDVSGRGVGMDVVRRNINGLGGMVNITSTEGQGSTIRIRLPLTLAILDGQLVRVGAEVYVISLVSIVETIQVKSDRLSAVAGRTELFRLRDEFLPVVRLYEQFGIDPDRRGTDGGLLVVVEADGTRVGVLVDDLLAQQQVVIKSLEANFRHVAGLAGATILGDGTVAPIIDVPGLIRSFAASQGARRPGAEAA